MLHGSHLWRVDKFPVAILLPSHFLPCSPLDGRWWQFSVPVASHYCITAAHCPWVLKELNRKTKIVFFCLQDWPLFLFTLIKNKTKQNTVNPHHPAMVTINISPSFLLIFLSPFFVEVFYGKSQTTCRHVISALQMSVGIPKSKDIFSHNLNTIITPKKVNNTPLILFNTPLIFFKISIGIY